MLIAFTHVKYCCCCWGTARVVDIPRSPPLGRSGASRLFAMCKSGRFYF